MARAKLMPVTCPSDKPASAKCYGTNGNVTSNHTNMVDGIPNQLPANVGEASGVLVTYYKMQGGSTNTPTSAGAFQFMASALVALSFVVTVLAI